MNYPLRIIFSVYMTLFLVCLSVFIQPLRGDEGVEFFEKKIRPVLVKHCYECHSAAASKVKGALRLDSREAMRRGGESGPAVVPHKIDESLLIEAIRHESFEMPPKDKLPAEVIADFERWVKMGAPDPRDQPPTASEAAELSWQATLTARRRWWSLQPVLDPNAPSVKNISWSGQSIDRFILSHLEDAGLTPAKPSRPRTLIRRLSFVIIGLPPSIEEVEDFVSEYSVSPDTAYDRLVNRLLDSPHFGERWARHWMDVVRFTETHGNEWNYEVHHGWRYRDYLIRAFNSDVPYDQFVREHIAGDLLTKPRWNEKERFNESVIGTAFYRFGEVNHDDCIALREIGFDIMDNQIDTLSKAFQATTVACARCHDHKIDAVSMKDYYALLGILRSSRPVSHTIDSPSVNAEPMRRLIDLKREIRKELAGRWLRNVDNIARYLLAAEAARCDRSDAAKLAAGLDAKRVEKWVAALSVEKLPLEHPLSPWLSLVAAVGGDDKEIASSWRTLRGLYVKRQHELRKFNDEQFLSFSNFHNGEFGDWQATGHGLRRGAVNSGDYCIAQQGDTVVDNVLLAGCFTHALSERLNGAIRSPVLRTSKKRISLQVMGDHTAAVRLVSNNCQLNYKNYRALTSDKLAWVTFSLPKDLANVRVYAELMTKFDNPKFPDQLGTLGGDKENDRIPWEEAAADPRSYFGVTRIVLHDGKATPKPTLSHFSKMFAEDQSITPRTWAEVAKCYATTIAGSIGAWNEGRASDDDARWLNWLVKHDLLDNSLQQSPRLAELVADYRRTEQEDLRLPRIVPGVGDIDGGFEQAVLVSGNCRNPGEVVRRRYLEVLKRDSKEFSSLGSGRLELAEQIASPQNPLTARVMVNRIWHHLFGAGIVRSVDDFGRVGELPTHPELLDHLAIRFMEQGWSIKTLIREIVQTQTFRMSNQLANEAKEIDPQNRLLHHYSVHRLDAEAIRDSILATSGRLDRSLYGLSVLSYREKENTYRRLFPGPLDGDGRRSVYIKVSLMESPRFLSAFNLPGGKVTQGRRDVTNVPTQALALLNDPFVAQQAEVWASRLVQRQQDSVGSRIDVMFQDALGRAPAIAEKKDFERLAHQLAALRQVKSDEMLMDRVIWKDVAHVMFNLKEFIYIP